MKKFFNVFNFTYKSAIKSKWFIVMLLSGVILIIGSMNLDKIMTWMGESESERSIAVYDTHGSIPLEELITQYPAEDFSYRVLESAEQADSVLEQMKGGNSEYMAAVIFGGDNSMTDIYLAAGIDHESADLMFSMASEVTMIWNANAIGLDSADINSIISRDNVNVVALDSQPNHQVLIVFLILFLYIIILLFGTMISNSIVEEKSNRIMETLICASNPRSLLFGKVFGMFAVSLTQMLVWAASAFLMLRLSPDALEALNNFGVASGTKMILLLVLFTLLGYLMYAMVFAALGSLADNAQDATQLMLPVTVVLIVVYIAAIFAVDSPNSPLIIVLSYLPFSSPIIAFSRAVLVDLPWYELVLTAMVQIVYIIGIGLISSRIYKKGVVSYGMVSDLFRKMKPRKTEHVEKVDVKG